MRVSSHLYHISSPYNVHNILKKFWILLGWCDPRTFQAIIHFVVSSIIFVRVGRSWCLSSHHFWVGFPNFYRLVRCQSLDRLAINFRVGYLVFNWGWGDSRAFLAIHFTVDFLILTLSLGSSVNDLFFFVYTCRGIFNACNVHTALPDLLSPDRSSSFTSVPHLHTSLPVVLIAQSSFRSFICTPIMRSFTCTQVLKVFSPAQRSCMSFTCTQVFQSFTWKQILMVFYLHVSPLVSFTFLHES